jgi:uncharacterized hydantoinase/oxoprolinase family protein
MSAFQELEALAQESFDWTRSTSLPAQVEQFQDATLEEVVDLLDEAVEVHTHLAATLPTHLLQSACQEVEFLTTLCRQMFGRRCRSLVPTADRRIIQNL